MPTLKIISETPIMMAQLKEDLERIRTRDAELNFRAGKTAEYLKYFVGLPGEKAVELFKKIEGMNVPRLKAEHIAKIVDLLPSSVEELKVILGSYTITVSAENISSLVDTVKPYLAENAAAIEAQVPAPEPAAEASAEKTEPPAASAAPAAE